MKQSHIISLNFFFYLLPMKEKQYFYEQCNNFYVENEKQFK